MKNIKSLVCLALLALSFTAEAHADFQLGHFRLSQVSVFQSGGSTYSGGLTWNPGYLSGDLSIRLNVGGSALKSRLDEIFPAFEYGLLAGYRLDDSFLVEAGGGFQYWVDNGGNRFMAMANCNYLFKDKVLGLIDRAIVGYTALFVPTKLTHEFRLGVGLSL